MYLIFKVDFRDDCFWEENDWSIVLVPVTISMFLYFDAAAAAKLLQSCPTLCDPIDSSPPGSAVPGILQARTLEWVVISFSRGSFRPRGWTQASSIASRRLNLWATREAQIPNCWLYSMRANTILYTFLSCLKKKREGNSTQNAFYWTGLINKKISSTF